MRSVMEDFANSSWGNSLKPSRHTWDYHTTQNARSKEIEKVPTSVCIDIYLILTLENKNESLLVGMSEAML